MIERIVLLKVRQEAANRQSVAEVAEHSRQVLRALPGVLDVHVGTAADGRTAEGWHLALVLRFASLEDIPPYADHPDHRAYVDDYLKPRIEALTAYNFEV